MSITSPATATSPSQKTNTSRFEENLNAAKSSQILVDYMKENGKSAINAGELSELASNKTGKVPPAIAAAASYMVRHSEVYTAIETHDVAGADGLSGVWNFEWAAAGGLKGSSVESLAAMTDTFDRAISKSAEITDITTSKKTELDATKQRPSN